MKMKRILVSVVTGALLTGSLLAAHGNDQVRSKSKIKANKPTATTTVKTSRNTAAVRTTRTTTAPRTRYVTTTSGNPRVTGTTGTPVRTRVVTRNSSYPYGSYGSYGYGYGGYPSYGYSYGPSVSFGFGYPYSYGYYPYDYYGYGYGGYPSSYRYGAYYYNDGYGHGSSVAAVQSRLARAGYYHGPIDGVMGPGTRHAILAYERDHGLRMDGVISGPLLRNMGLRY